MNNGKNLYILSKNYGIFPIHYGIEAALKLYNLDLNDTKYQILNFENYL